MNPEINQATVNSVIFISAMVEVVIAGLLLWIGSQVFKWEDELNERSEGLGEESAMYIEAAAQIKAWHAQLTEREKVIEATEAKLYKEVKG